MFLPKNIQYVYIMSKQKETNSNLYFLVSSSPYCFFVFLNNNLCTCSNPQKKPPQLLNRQAEETSTEAAGKQSQEALEEARAQRLKEWRDEWTTDRRFPTTFFVDAKKKNRCREISGMEKEIERNQSVVGWHFFSYWNKFGWISIAMLPERNNRVETPLIPRGA